MVPDWHEKSEKNSKLFLNVENTCTRSGKTAVRQLFDSQGRITVNSQTIMNKLRGYYQNLNSNQDSHLSEEFCSDFLDSNSMLILIEQRWYAKEESFRARNVMKSSKSFLRVKLPVTTV